MARDRKTESNFRFINNLLKHNIPRSSCRAVRFIRLAPRVPRCFCRLMLPARQAGVPGSRCAGLHVLKKQNQNICGCLSGASSLPYVSFLYTAFHPPGGRSLFCSDFFTLYHILYKHEHIKIQNKKKVVFIYIL